MHKMSRNRLNERVIRDIAKRSVIGIPLYLIIWGIIMLTTDVRREAPLFAYGILIGFCVLALLRFLHQQYFLRFDQTYRVVNYHLLVASVLVSATVWSLAFMKLVLGSNSTLKLLMVMTTAGLCAGGNSAYAPDRRLGISYMAIMLVPASCAIAYRIPTEISIALLMLVYLGFMTAMGNRATREYWSALENEAELKEKTRELERISEIDGLTGIYNRRYFDKVLEDEWQRATRGKTPLTLILLDFDYFKDVNDTYGHLAGDEFLKKASQVFCSTFQRRTDVVARYGGEEFAILLPGIGEHDALRLFELARARIEGLTIVYENHTIQTTVSMGIASRGPEYHESRGVLIADADEALYHAKNNGRNQVQLYVHPENTK